MSAYTPQFGYTYSAPASQLLVGQSGAATPTSGCCEGGRTIMTDPVSGQPVCSCQYDRLTLGSYSRLGSGLGASGGVYGTAYPSTEQNPYPSIGMDSSPFYGHLSSGYSMKDGAAGDMSVYGTGLSASPATYYPYDPTFAAYGYGPSYDLAARRKNATRESTATLKAWLNEHKKNPYPTKGEKIMLAIITKMTLTQVSTWFANARRRLKKENKMTWEPRNKTDDDDAKLSDDEEEDKEGPDKDEEDMKKAEKEELQITETKVEDGPQTELKSCEGPGVKPVTAALSPLPPGALHNNNNIPFTVAKGEKSDCAVSLPSAKPKIWSLADTAACKTPPPNGVNGAVGGWLAGGTTFPLPPTIPPAQANYSRFSHLMSNVNQSQYMVGYSNGESVGTDTPPQTPPNAKTSNSSGGGQTNHMSSNGYLGSSTSYAEMNGTLSSCSRGATMVAASGNSAPVGESGSLHSRYTGSSSALGTHGTNGQVSTLGTASFSPVYKSNQQGSQQTAQQGVALSPQQQLACQRVHQQSQVSTRHYTS